MRNLPAGWPPRCHEPNPRHNVTFTTPPRPANVQLWRYISTTSAHGCHSSESRRYKLAGPAPKGKGSRARRAGNRCRPRLASPQTPPGGGTRRHSCPAQAPPSPQTDTVQQSHPRIRRSLSVTARDVAAKRTGVRGGAGADAEVCPVEVCGPRLWPHSPGRVAPNLHPRGEDQRSSPRSDRFCNSLPSGW
jgi:hypothetical protein